MLLRISMLSSITLFVLSAPTLAFSAPFCANIRGIVSECYYYDSDLCRRRAKEQGGRCQVNLDEVTLPSGYGSFCMVASYGVINCVYEDFDNCEREAERNKGVCVYNPNYSTLPELYEYDADLAY